MAAGRIALIIEATGCDGVVASELENIMRDFVFKSNLDWQTADELKDAARVAFEIFQELETTGH